MPSAVDVLEPFREAVAAFGVIASKEGDPVPASNNGLLDSAERFQQEAGIAISAGTYVLHVEAGALGALSPDDVIVVEGARYVYRGPAPGDLRVQHLQLVPEEP